MRNVPGELLERRIEDVRELQSSETERYAIVKDTETGEHYLHYRYLHRDVAAGGAASSYHQLMPLESDDVLGLLFGGERYAYPDNWTRPYLRNGPDGLYIWFDPSPATGGEESEREAERIRQALLTFKQKGSHAPEDIARLLRELDDHRNG